MKLTTLKPCEDAAIWLATQPDPETAWNTCHRSDWMIWLLKTIIYDDPKAYRLFACWCVRNTPLADGRKVWDLLTDPRSKNAVEVAERFAVGEATEQERAAAAAAAGAAADAAAGAADAAGDAAGAAADAAWAAAGADADAAWAAAAGDADAAWAAAWAAAGGAAAAAAAATAAAAAGDADAAGAAADAAAAAAAAAVWNAAAGDAQTNKLRDMIPFSAFSHLLGNGYE